MSQKVHTKNSHDKIVFNLDESVLNENNKGQSNYMDLMKVFQIEDDIVYNVNSDNECELKSC